jgi:hypothetical protein
MVRICSTLLVVVMACLVAANVAFAQEQKKGGKRGGTPEDRKARAEKRFDDMEKAVKHDPLKGELTKDEFLKAMKEMSQGKMGDRAEEFFKRMKKADESKITKAEYVTAISEMMGGRGKKKQEEKK